MLTLIANATPVTSNATMSVTELTTGIAIAIASATPTLTLPPTATTFAASPIATATAFSSFLNATPAPPQSAIPIVAASAGSTTLIATATALRPRLRRPPFPTRQLQAAPRLSKLLMPALSSTTRVS